MEPKYVQTVITYDIQDDYENDDYARNALRDLLEDMGYEDGDNQSTMLHIRRILKRTLDSINALCKEVKFNIGDEFSIYIVRQPNEKHPPVIEKTRFLYSRRANQFQ